MTDEERKKPKQKRSQKMVDDILQGTKIALDKFGIDKISSSNISEMTGISVGSFYQYFKNKDFALVKFAKKIASSYSKDFVETLNNVEDMELLEAVEVLSREYIDIVLKNSDLLISLPKVIWSLGQSTFFIDNRKKVADKIVHILIDKTGKDELECSKFAWLLINTVNGTLHHTFQSQDCIYDKEELKESIINNVIFMTKTFVNTQ